LRNRSHTDAAVLDRDVEHSALALHFQPERGPSMRDDVRQQFPDDYSGFFRDDVRHCPAPEQRVNLMPDAGHDDELRLADPFGLSGQVGHREEHDRSASLRLNPTRRSPTTAHTSPLLRPTFMSTGSPFRQTA
jgi:hypothetical protein